MKGKLKKIALAIWNQGGRAVMGTLLALALVKHTGLDPATAQQAGQAASATVDAVIAQ